MGMINWFGDAIGFTLVLGALASGVAFLFWSFAPEALDRALWWLTSKAK